MELIKFQNNSIQELEKLLFINRIYVRHLKQNKSRRSSGDICFYSLLSFCFALFRSSAISIASPDALRRLLESLRSLVLVRVSSCSFRSSFRDNSGPCSRLDSGVDDHHYHIICVAVSVRKSWVADFAWLVSLSNHIVVC